MNRKIDCDESIKCSCIQVKSYVLLLRLSTKKTKKTEEKKVKLDVCSFLFSTVFFFKFYFYLHRGECKKKHIVFETIYMTYKMSLRSTQFCADETK